MTHPTQGEFPLDDETPKKPQRMSEETRQRGLRGVERARKVLNDPKGYSAEGGHCGLWEDGVMGQWFYDVKPSPVDYFKAGTHGQVYSNYAPAAPGVSTPKKAGPPPPGATSSRPVEDKPPTLSSRSYFSQGTQGQPMPRDRSKRDRSKEARQQRESRSVRIDKTTPYDTFTRKELMQHREEEAQRMRAEKK